MTDKQIFENEIKCITRWNECVCNGGSDCVKCDLLMDSEEIVKCYNRAIKNIDLINRQKAEIERLKMVIEQIEDDLQPLPFETNFEKAAKRIKSEAIKEFAERLKSRLANLSVQTKTHGRKTTPNYVDDIANQILHDVVPQEIDNLVKEMKRGCK